MRPESHSGQSSPITCVCYYILEQDYEYLIALVMTYLLHSILYPSKLSSLVITKIYKTRIYPTTKNSQQTNNTGTSVLLTTFLQQKLHRHSVPPNQQNYHKHGSCNSGRCHHKLPPSYSSYSTGGEDYHTIDSVRKLLSANARSIESHVGGGALGHLGIIVSSATYATVATAHPWENPEPPGGSPNKIFGGTAVALLAERHRWEEAVVIFRTWTTVDQSLKEQIMTAFEPMYLEILNNDMVGFANTNARDMLDHLFLSYGSITDVDLEHN
jgi:hypothetical protein